MAVDFRQSTTCRLDLMCTLIRAHALRTGADLIEPVRVCNANQVLKGQQLGHLAGRVVPHSLKNELALADLD